MAVFLSTKMSRNYFDRVWYEPSRMADMGVTPTSRYIRSTHPRMVSISASDGSGNSNFQTAPEKRKSGNALVSCYGLV